MGRSFKNETHEKEQIPETTRPQAPAPTPAPQPQNVPVPAAKVENTTATRTENAAPRHAVTESEALARDIKEGIMNGFVGGTTVLTGDADFKGMLRIDGRFTGRINSEKGTLIVSTGGVVEADITVATARINGTVNGDINATERIEFGRTAQVRGNIHTPSLIIENGAIFEGGCRMTRSSAVAEKPRSADTQPLKVVEKDSRLPPPEKVKAAPAAEVVKAAR